MVAAPPRPKAATPNGHSVRRHGLLDLAQRADAEQQDAATEEHERGDREGRRTRATGPGSSWPRRVMARLPMMAVGGQEQHDRGRVADAHQGVGDRRMDGRAEAGQHAQDRPRD